MTNLNALNGQSAHFRKDIFYLCPLCKRVVLNYLPDVRGGMHVWVCPKCNKEVPAEKIIPLTSDD